MKALILLAYLISNGTLSYGMPTGYTKVDAARVHEYTLVMSQAIDKSKLVCTGVTYEGEAFDAPLYQVVASIEAAQEVYLKDDRAEPILLFVTLHAQRRIESLVTTSTDHKTPIRVDMVQTDKITRIINDGDLIDPRLREEHTVLQTATGLCQIPPIVDRH